MKITLTVNAVCDIGCKKPSNEDMILLHDKMFRDGKRKVVFNTKTGFLKDRVIIAVADGVGGLNKGEIASEQVLKSLSSMLMNIPDDLDNVELRNVFEIYTAETHASLAKDMGSTLVGLFFYNGKLFKYHAGDSRIYRMIKGEMERLTVDHSLCESGGQKDAPSNVITNSIGGGSSAFIEFAEIENPFGNNYYYLLSSDGMHDMVSKSEISNLMDQADGADKLNDLAKKYGGKDNISIVTVKINM